MWGSRKQILEFLGYILYLSNGWS